jgi:Ala-tRNA(Pro) deacylase
MHEDFGRTDEQKKQTVLDFFALHGLPYRMYEHPAFFTVADAHAHIHEHGAVHAAGAVGCKNLFLKNYVESAAQKSEEPRYYLYVLPDTARADLKSFASFVGEKKVSFASPEELLEHLGVTPGSVSLCGLINDIEKRVKVYIARDVYNAPVVHLHPNINTCSLEIEHETLMKYLAALKREVGVLASVVFDEQHMRV